MLDILLVYMYMLLLYQSIELLITLYSAFCHIFSNSIFCSIHGHLLFLLLMITIITSPPRVFMWCLIITIRLNTVGLQVPIHKHPLFIRCYTLCRHSQYSRFECDDEFLVLFNDTLCFTKLNNFNSMSSWDLFAFFSYQNLNLLNFSNLLQYWTNYFIDNCLIHWNQQKTFHQYVVEILVILIG